MADFKRPCLKLWAFNFGHPCPSLVKSDVLSPTKIRATTGGIVPPSLALHQPFQNRTIPRLALNLPPLSKVRFCRPQNSGDYRRDCSAIPRPLHNNITQLITFLTITPYFNIFSQLTICFIIIIIHRHLNILELINLSNIFQTSKIPLIKNVAIFALLLYNDKKTIFKFKEEYYGKKYIKNLCKRRK